MFLQSAKSRASFYFEYIGYVPLLIPCQRPESCFKAKISSCLDRDMTIFRDFEGPRPRRDIGIAKTRHSKTCLETETRLETSSSAPNHCAALPTRHVSLILKMFHNFGQRLFKKCFIDSKRSVVGSIEFSFLTTIHFFPFYLFTLNL